MKKILNIILITFMALSVIFLFVFANIKQKEIICGKFEINVDYDGAPQLLDKTVVRNLITEAGIKIKGQPIENIPVRKLTKLLNANPYIKKATISVSVNGNVKATILQRNPLVRVVDRDFNQVIIDHEGHLMPINIDFPIRLVMANGNIQNIALSRKIAKLASANKHHSSKLRQDQTLPEDLSKVYKIALKLEADTLTSALIEQIYINDNKEIELIPILGDQSIFLGDTVALNDKIMKLKAFYEHGMKTFAWNNYKLINLKYKNQVVCSK